METELKKVRDNAEQNSEQILGKITNVETNSQDLNSKIGQLKSNLSKLIHFQIILNYQNSRFSPILLELTALY